MRLYIMRHGETAWNAQRKIQGVADIPLDEKGRKLAEITGRALRDVKFDLVITSPLCRAKETARLVIEDRMIPWIEDQRIQEICFGVMEGMQISGSDHPQFQENLQKFFQDPWNFQAPENGESIEDVCRRTREFWNDMIHKEEYQEDTILISSHGCASRALMQNVYQDHDFWHGKVPPNCSINIVDVINGDVTLVAADKIYY